MAATTKDGLLAVTEKEFVKLDKVLDRVDDDIALTKDDDDVAIKDIVGHRAHWIDLFLGWHRDGLVGAEVFFPAEGYKWNDLKRYNADLRLAQADLDWPGARLLLGQSYERLIAFITACSEHELYGGPMVGANNQWTPGRWAEAAGPSHFRSAAKYVRSRLRTSATSGS